MVEREMMIDYRDSKGTIRRKHIDDMEFCVKDGEVFFISDEQKYCIQLENVCQVYVN